MKKGCGECTGWFRKAIPSNMEYCFTKPNQKPRKQKKAHWWM